MSALDEVIEYSDGTYKQLPVAEARAELAQLRADIARLTQERDTAQAAIVSIIELGKDSYNISDLDRWRKMWKAACDVKESWRKSC